MPFIPLQEEDIFFEKQEDENYDYELFSRLYLENQG